jgi:drug/metabolite transporter (DMT)-like permease
LSTTVFLAVLAAALLHAVWNAMVKSGADKHLAMTAVVLGHLPIALAVLPFVPLPPREAWPYLLAGLALHTGYQAFLILSYRIGDLTQVYPIARGSAPLIVTAVSVLVLGVDLAPLELLAVATIAAGIMSLSLVRRQDGLRNPRAAGYALVTGCFIAAYSLVDGTGARLYGSALGYFGWASIGNAVVFTLISRMIRPGMITEIARTAKRTALLSGSASFVAYSLVIWAFMHAPIALVTALRETSIVFALLIGVVVLRERLDLAKVASAMITLFGSALLRLAR